MKSLVRISSVRAYVVIQSLTDKLLHYRLTLLTKKKFISFQFLHFQKPSLHVPPTHPFPHFMPGLSFKNHGRYLSNVSPTGRPFFTCCWVHCVQLDVVSESNIKM